jgi:hypothetical protein
MQRLVRKKHPEYLYAIEFVVSYSYFQGSIYLKSELNVGQFAVNVGRERRCALSPPSPYPRQPSDLPPPPLSPLRVKYELGR